MLLAIGFKGAGGHAGTRTPECSLRAGESRTRADRDPQPAPFVSTKTRAEVRAEAAEALRLGLIPHSEYSTRHATAAELELVRLAGQRARAAEERLAGK